LICTISARSSEILWASRTAQFELAHPQQQDAAQNSTQHEIVFTKKFKHDSVVNNFLNAFTANNYNTSQQANIIANKHLGAKILPKRLNSKYQFTALMIFISQNCYMLAI
jgi:azurin